MFAWIGRLRTLPKRFAVARVVAEALAWHHGERGVAIAEAAAANDRVSDEEWHHNRLVAKLTAQRHRFLSGLDLPARYDIWQHWRSRPGQMIFPQDCEWAGDAVDLRQFGRLLEHEAGEDLVEAEARSDDEHRAGDRLRSAWSSSAPRTS
jgi:hypothetical protein